MKLLIEINVHKEPDGSYMAMAFVKGMKGWISGRGDTVEKSATDCKNQCYVTFHPNTDLEFTVFDFTTVNSI